MDDYRAFLESKVKAATLDGFEVDESDVNPALKPHIRTAVRWAARGGRRALFSRFGTQKTTFHLELMRITSRVINEPALIVLPLGARLSFFHDAQAFFTGKHAIKLNFIRDDSEINRNAINLTNVEQVREGNIDPRRFGCKTFDEADILRNMNTKTFWAFTERAKHVRYRHVGTATPDPRETAELLAFAGYLDIMDVGEARTRFFKRNSEKADELTLHPHKELEFWEWVATWSLWIQKPSDVDPSFSDAGYELPPLDIRWHEIPTDHRNAGGEKDGQLRLMKDSAAGVQTTAKEKRESIPARIAKMMELRAENPAAHRMLWHHLEDERRAIEKAVPTAVTVYGSQDLEAREQHLIDFAEGRVHELAGKPSMIGSGGNYQKHCCWAIFLGIDWKFKDLIQAVHRLLRYGQTFKDVLDGQAKAVRVDFIHTEAERNIVRSILDDWRRFDEQVARMSSLIREFGLTQRAIEGTLKRSMGVARVEVRGERFTCVNNDCVDETRSMAENSVDAIVSSLPFSTQYEYTPSYNDFGHTDDDDHFFRQMDFLTPELFRVLKPGRIAAIHCKDRIVEGSRSGLGFQTVSAFGDEVKAHFKAHGFAHIGTKIIVTDVVRENNQTYRLGWTEQCKDGSRMGYGLPEYLHLFRKPQSDRSRGYADEPVIKGKRIWVRYLDRNGQREELDEDELEAVLEQYEDAGTVDGDLALAPMRGFWDVRPPVKRRKGDNAPAPELGEGYSRARWQVDANGFDRSAGNRLLLPSELAALNKGIYRTFKKHNLTTVYDFEHHVACGEALDEKGKLSPKYSIIPAHSWHPDVWTDVVRMLSLNTDQHSKGREKHLCPLPLDIVNRVIKRCTMPGELVLDPFGGLGTVAYCAIKQGRRGYSIELNAGYHKDAVGYCRAAEVEATAPTLFDWRKIEEQQPVEREAAA